ncbi:MAG: class I SAM-dependent methyltransferase [Rhodopila sp.]
MRNGDVTGRFRTGTAFHVDAGAAAGIRPDPGDTVTPRSGQPEGNLGRQHPADRALSPYDRLAPEFDRQRPVPEDAAQAARAAILAELPPGARILDAGAGSGGIGWPFVAGGDDYHAIDLSVGMLRMFTSRTETTWRCLAQADAAHPPFADATFDAVLLMRVLSGAANWSAILDAARRLLRPDGVLFLGRAVTLEDGLNACLKQQLEEYLAARGAFPYRQHARENALTWLDSVGHRTTRTVAQWQVRRTPRQFIERHGAGVRFQRLDPDLRTAALRSLVNWVESRFGSIDAEFDETQYFEFHTIRFTPEASS